MLLFLIKTYPPVCMIGSITTNSGVPYHFVFATDNLSMSSARSFWFVQRYIICSNLFLLIQATQPLRTGGLCRNDAIHSAQGDRSTIFLRQEWKHLISRQLRQMHAPDDTTGVDIQASTCALGLSRTFLNGTCAPAVVSSPLG